MQKSTAIANSNIAIIKYWGKRDEQLMLPTNSSISFTMDEQLSTVTTVEFDNSLKQDELVLDDAPSKEKELLRVSGFLDLVRAKAGVAARARVVSKNSFPKAAGLASSASAFAALSLAASKAAGLSLAPDELSVLARMGSGSACRSIYGGAVEWQKGIKADGSDSFAVELSPPEKWKELRNAIVILDSKEKKNQSQERNAAHSKNFETIQKKNARSS